MEERLWGQLGSNGYRNKKELRSQEEGEEQKEGRRWYGLTSMVRYTERLKAIMRREGIRTFRKGGKKLEQQVKEKMRKKEEKENE